jgi:hypothetical protein
LQRWNTLSWLAVVLVAVTKAVVAVRVAFYLPQAMLYPVDRLLR